MPAIETEATTVTLEEGLLTIRSKGVFSTPQSIEKTFQAVTDLAGSGRYPMLFDAREWPGGDPEGWVIVISRIGQLFPAVAMLINPGAGGDVSQFPQVIDRLVIPFITSTDETEASAFLKMFQSFDQ